MLKMIIQFRSAALGRIAIRSRNAKLSLGFLAISLISHCVSPTAQAGIVVADSGFESPVAGVWYSPSVDAQGGSGWEFQNYFAGISGNGSGFNPIAPFGEQVGFIHQWSGMGNVLSSLSQTISGFDDSLYEVSFYAAGKDGTNPFVVAFDGNVLTFSDSNVVLPVDLSSGKQGYQFFQSDPVHLTAGAHTLSFTSSAPQEHHTSFIDHVVVSSTVPEPSSLALLGIGGIGFAVSVYRRRMTKIGFLSGIRGR